MIQESNENLSMNVSLNNGVTSQNPENSRGLFTPYQQQTHHINQMLQNQMLIELHNQLRSMEERASLCMKVKNSAIEDEKIKCAQLEMKLTMALAEADYWRMLLEQKNELCKDLAGKLLKVRRNELAAQMSMGVARFAEEAESSTGDNGDDIVDTTRTRCKRRRV